MGDTHLTIIEGIAETLDNPSYGGNKTDDGCHPVVPDKHLDHLNESRRASAARKQSGKDVTTIN